MAKIIFLTIVIAIVLLMVRQRRWLKGGINIRQIQTLLPPVTVTILMVMVVMMMTLGLVSKQLNPNLPGFSVEGGSSTTTAYYVGLATSIIGAIIALWWKTSLRDERESMISIGWILVVFGLATLGLKAKNDYSQRNVLTPFDQSGSYEIVGAEEALKLFPEDFTKQRAVTMYKIIRLDSGEYFTFSVNPNGFGLPTADQLEICANGELAWVYGKRESSKKDNGCYRSGWSGWVHISKLPLQVTAYWTYHNDPSDRVFKETVRFPGDPNRYEQIAKKVNPGKKLLTTIPKGSSVGSDIPIWFPQREPNTGSVRSYERFIFKNLNKETAMVLIAVVK